MLLFFPLILTADFNAESRRMQSQLMSLAMAPTHKRSKNESDCLWLYLRLHEERNDDPCTWRGVECTDGEVQSLIFQRKYHRNIRSNDYPAWIVDMRFLPSTAREIYFRHIDLLDGWRASALPRDLRCMHLRLCSSRRKYDLIENKKLKQDLHIDLCSLPQQIEELTIFDGWWIGPLVISALPSAMRLCIILHSNISSVYVDNAQLPESLEIFSVCPTSQKLTQKERCKNDLDARIRVHRGRSAWQRASKFDVLSKYLQRLDGIAQHILSANEAIGISDLTQRGVDC